MPETHFEIEWPDGSQESCYSPSSVVKKYFSADREYLLGEFIALSRTAFQTASDRVQAKYHLPCSKALGQLQHLEQTATKYNNLPQPKVRLIRFIES
ncbi:MAG: MSMEG_0570 family nitrogen starvation response protein [Cyanobacteria bacterium SW_11_48_12]|nr:MAG: MSMEG_0570 family nitrogen starvation response protein [Cyanobacteria bacterium SW_11_48_12]